MDLEAGLAAVMLLFVVGFVWAGYYQLEDLEAFEREGGTRKLHWAFALAYRIWGPRGPAILFWIGAILPLVFVIGLVADATGKYRFWRQVARIR